MTWIIPTRTDYTLELGDRGIAVWSLQKQLVDDNIECVPDGVFGALTESAVRVLQRQLRLTQDGKAGPKTQSSSSRRQANVFKELPLDLLWSNCSYESSGLYSAVNWSVPGGVDVCTMQRRISSVDFDDEAVIERAFHSKYQMGLAKRTLQNRFQAYMERPGTKNKPELCWRDAVLFHNYPALSDKISWLGVTGLSTYYTSPQKWVLDHGLHFPDGTPIRTPLEWGQRYSLGASAHDEPGQAVRFVKSWSVP